MSTKANRPNPLDLEHRSASKERLKFGYFFRLLRTNFEWTQEKMALRLNTSRANYSKIESDKIHPSAEQLTRLFWLAADSESEALKEVFRTNFFAGLTRE